MLQNTITKPIMSKRNAKRKASRVRAISNNNTNSEVIDQINLFLAHHITETMLIILLAL